MWMDEGFRYEENLKTDLAPGQVIVIGTDGIWETCNRGGQMYGKERFRNIIRENVHLPANEMIDAVYSDLRNFASGVKPADDITLVIIKLEDLP